MSKIKKHEAKIIGLIGVVVGLYVTFQIETFNQFDKWMPPPNVSLGFVIIVLSLLLSGLIKINKEKTK